MPFVIGFCHDCESIFPIVTGSIEVRRLILRAGTRPNGKGDDVGGEQSLS